MEDSPEADRSSDPPTVEEDPGEDGDSVFGPRPDEPRGPIDPGTPDLENAAFVLLGVAVSLLIVADLIGLL